MNKIKELLRKYKGLINYIIFGILTTIINIISYYVFYNILNINNVLSTIISWVLATIFAFITNKLIVFESKILKLKNVIYELLLFYLCRIGTGLLDVFIMWVSVDIYKCNALIFKIISNIIVIIINYIASKLVIFKKKSV